MNDDLIQRLREAVDWDAASAHEAKLFDEAANEIERLREELETERMRLAACGTAALGHFEGCKDEYRSASLEDVLKLRYRLAASKNLEETYRAEVVKLSGILATLRVQQAQEPDARVSGDRQAGLFNPLPHGTLLYATTQGTEAALEKAREAFGEIAWSNDTGWQSDRAKAALVAIDAVLGKKP